MMRRPTLWKSLITLSQRYPNGKMTSKGVPDLVYFNGMKQLKEGEYTSAIRNILYRIQQI